MNDKKRKEQVYRTRREMKIRRKENQTQKEEVKEKSKTNWGDNCIVGGEGKRHEERKTSIKGKLDNDNVAKRYIRGKKNKRSRGQIEKDMLRKKGEGQAQKKRIGQSDEGGEGIRRKEKKRTLA